MIFNLPIGLQGYFLNEVCCKHGDAMQIEYIPMPYATDEEIAFDEFIWIHKKQSMSPNGYNRVLDGVGSREAHHTDKETTQ